MNGRIKKSRLGVSVDYHYMSDKERIFILETENQELSLEIQDLRTSLELNKISMIEVITATTSEKRQQALVHTINKLVEENMKLQSEVQRVQNELLSDIRKAYADTVRGIEDIKNYEDAKNNHSTLNVPSNGSLKHEFPQSNNFNYGHNDIEIQNEYDYNDR